MTAGASAHGRQTHQEHVGRWTEKDSTGGGQSEGHGVAPRAVWAGGGGGRKGRWQGQCGQVEAGAAMPWGPARGGRTARGAAWPRQTGRRHQR